MVKDEHSWVQFGSTEATSNTQVGSINSEKEEHEKPASLADWEAGSDDAPAHGDSRRCVGSVRSGKTLSRSVSEVGNGIQNQRDPCFVREEGLARADSPGSRDATQVQWDGPGDPANPKCWPIKGKWSAVFCASLRPVYLCPRIRPGALGLGPPLGATRGVIIIQISNVVFLLFNLGCGLARTEGQMIAFRFLAGIGGSAPLAIGGGLPSDLFSDEGRGRVMSLYMMFLYGMIYVHSLGDQVPRVAGHSGL
ncbi:hypothetical protein CDD83_985 [Cordyceps sp. RAO-2017]|nr:hypothetical protein CDD83_985 [Cordyceps sp. RAO-2017]